ncbi:MAG: hypothetical protein RLZZ600_1109 [Actinomycetota bacterium]|jgi:hypothetical protein
MKKFLTRLAATLGAVCLAIGGLALGSAPARATSQDILSPTGHQAIADLRTCLAHTPENQEPVLNVYYLVDASGSLFPKDQGGDGTDPDFKRAEILQNSLVQLAALTDSNGNPVDLNYALGFFGNQFQGVTGWTPVTQNSANKQGERIRNAIRSQPAMGSTNWQLGLQGAQSALNKQESRKPGCSALVWFTDGGINIDGQDGPQTAKAVQELCSPRGTFAQLRQAGIVTFGVLYSLVSDPQAQVLMQKLVEGAAGSDKCGGGPDAYPTHGAFIKANSTKDLSLVFMQLGGLIAGGTPSQINADGTFTVDPGVDSFEIIAGTSPDQVSVFSPSGQVDLSDGSSLCSANALTGTMQLTCKPQARSDFGGWKITGVESASPTLLLFGGLTLQLQEKISILAGTGPVKITGSIGVTRPDVLKLSDYNRKLIVGTVGENGKFTELQQVVSDEAGKYTFTFPNDSGLSSITFRASLENVTTKLHNQPLIQVQKSVDALVGVPADYPTIEQNSLALSEMMGKNTPATGKMTMRGPETAGLAGSICVPGGAFAPKIVSDSDPEREKSWVWTLEEKGKPAPDCIELKSGETKTFTVTASNDRAANSLVKAKATFVLKSDGKTDLPREIPISFASSHNVSALVFWPLVILLCLLGLLLPILVMYLVNFFTTKVEYGDKLIRAVLDAKLSLDHDSILVAQTPSGTPNTPLANVANPQELFKFMPPQPDARRITDSEIGTFVARISRFPLNAPRFEVAAKTGHVVIVGSSKAMVRKPGARYALGTLAPFSGRVSKTWALVIAESEIAKLAHKPATATAPLQVPGASPVASAAMTPGNEINAKLVVFDLIGSGGESQARSRFVDVSNEANPSKSLAHLVEGQKTHKPVRAPKAPRVGKGDKGSKPQTGGSTLPPPPPVPGAGSVPLPPSIGSPGTPIPPAPPSVGSAPLPPPPPSSGSIPPPPPPPNF